MSNLLVCVLCVYVCVGVGVGLLQININKCYVLCDVRLPYSDKIHLFIVSLILSLILIRISSSSSSHPHHRR